MNRIKADWKRIELNGGKVSTIDDGWRFTVSPRSEGYANAQLDDYRGAKFRWREETRFTVLARFSEEPEALVGTAGFGFWNAPFGPGTGARVRLPRAVWFFYASPASDLPLAPVGEQGNGWFAATVDAQTWRALRWAPLLFPVLVLNQLYALRRVLWPLVRRDLNISFERLNVSMRTWHQYGIEWRKEGTVFSVDGAPVLTTPRAVRGPLGFVTWIDNQAMVLTPRGKVRWTTEVVTRAQWMEVKRLFIGAIE